MPDRHFTLKEAKELVPWLAEEFKSLKESLDRSATLKDDVDSLQEGLITNGRKAVDKELDTAIRALTEESSAIEKSLTGIQELGVLVKQAAPGLVDFPHLLEGREVYLCWQEGEEDIRYWHEIDGGFNGRQPI